MGRTMKQLADAVSKEINLPERAGRRFVRRFLEVLADDLVETGRVDLRGFGSFSLSTRKARSATHPKTHKKLKIRATRFVKFRTALAIRHRLNPKPVKTSIAEPSTPAPPPV